MLVLSRKAGERLVIGDGIVVRIASIGPTVRLAIEAPADVLILRGELVGTPPRVVEATGPLQDEPPKLEAA